MSEIKDRLPACCLALLLATGCSVEEEPTEQEFYGEFDLANDLDKADGPGRAAVPVSADDSDTVVWEVRNDWADTDTAEARQAGLAWPEDSGLDWNEKYALWIASMTRIDRHDGGYKTFQITNPQGKTLPAPVLECAELAYFLRAAFASWHHLPYFMEAVDSDGTRVFFGHFGWRTASGRYKSSNLFRRWYRDYSGGEYTADTWPRDEKLRGKKLYGSNDDFQPFIGEDARAGTYFDEMFLNKRVGHFLILFLSNFGSIHLADSGNTFNLAPEALRPGDVMLERWQRRGIGHTLVVKSVEPGLIEGKLVAELASGSMPRRQPRWEDAVASKRYFTMNACGGPGTNYSGDEYAKLGGGLKRWRVARASESFYTNTIMPEDFDHWVSSTDYEAIAARTGEFGELLEEPDPGAMRDALLEIIESKRAHLREHPASCSARIAREETFDALYELLDEEFRMSTLEVDRLYRKFEDYVFAELIYPESKTCCWNSTTAAMYEIVMDHAQQNLAWGEACTAPRVFMNDDGYGVFADHADSLGRGEEWVAWSEDEPCSQRDTASDVQAEHRWTDFCSIIEDVVGDPPCQDDALEDNDSLETATPTEAGTQSGLILCNGDEDFFEVHATAGTLQASIAFTAADGDLELELLDAAGERVDSSTGMDDFEIVQTEVTEEADYYVRVYGFRDAINTYELTVVLP